MCWCRSSWFGGFSWDAKVETETRRDILLQMVEANRGSLTDLEIGDGRVYTLDTACALLTGACVRRWRFCLIALPCVMAVGLRDLQTGRCRRLG